MSRPSKKYYDVVEQRDGLVWDVCEYLRQAKDINAQCEQCPAWRVEAGMDEKTKRMCRALAEEVGAKVLADFTENPVVTLALRSADTS